MSRRPLDPNDTPHWPTVWLVVIALVLAFGLVGAGDYADQVERERDQLRAAVSGCRLAASLHKTGEAQP